MNAIRTSGNPSEAAWNQFLTEFRAWCESEEAGKFIKQLPALI